MLSGSEANTLREKGVALILAPPLRVFWLRDWACKAGAEGEGEMSEATMLDPTPELLFRVWPARQGRKRCLETRPSPFVRS